jgi:hypothetical protein
MTTFKDRLIGSRTSPRKLLLFVPLSLALLLPLASAASASGAVGWGVHGVSEPTVFAAGDALACGAEGKCDRHQLLVLNSGDDASSGAIALKDGLPAGVAIEESRLWVCSAAAVLKRRR